MSVTEGMYRFYCAYSHENGSTDKDFKALKLQRRFLLRYSTIYWNPNIYPTNSQSVQNVI